MGMSNYSHILREVRIVIILVRDATYLAAKQFLAKIISPFLLFNTTQALALTFGMVG